MNFGVRMLSLNVNLDVVHIYSGCGSHLSIFRVLKKL